MKVVNVNSLITETYLLNEHRCRLCGRLVVKLDEYQFMDKVGMCLSCDHILPDGAVSVGNLLAEIEGLQDDSLMAHADGSITSA